MLLKKVSIISLKDEMEPKLSEKYWLIFMLGLENEWHNHLSYLSIRPSFTHSRTVSVQVTRKRADLSEAWCDKCELNMVD